MSQAICPIYWRSGTIPEWPNFVSRKIERGLVHIRLALRLLPSSPEEPSKHHQQEHPQCSTYSSSNDPLCIGSLLLLGIRRVAHGDVCACSWIRSGLDRGIYYQVIEIKIAIGIGVGKLHRMWAIFEPTSGKYCCQQSLFHVYIVLTGYLRSECIIRSIIGYISATIEATRQCC
jgi:hypothetical protein